VCKTKLEKSNLARKSGTQSAYSGKRETRTMKDADDHELFDEAVSKQAGQAPTFNLQGQVNEARIIARG